MFCFIVVYICFDVVCYNFDFICCIVVLLCVWVVIKVNVYGYGIEWIYLGFVVVDGIVLFDFDEVVCVCEFGWDKFVLLFEGVFELVDVEFVDCYWLMVVVYCDE